MEFGIGKCTVLVWNAASDVWRMELRNKDKIRTLGEKETNKYLAIFEANTIKEVEIKEKLGKSVSGEPENYSIQNYVVDTLSNK